MMSDQFPILVLAIPLLMSFAIIIFARSNNNLAFSLLVLAMIGSFLSAIGTLALVLRIGAPFHYELGNWQAPFGIELVIDHLNALVLIVVSGVALLTAVYSRETVKQEVPDRIPYYYTLYSLLATGLLGMVATGDVFNLYVLLEISALSTYAILALGRGRAYYATFKYVIMGTIGACFYLLGVGYLYIKTGSLNMADLSTILIRPEMHQSVTIQIAFMLIIIGIWIKMAFFPLHGWLPNAYTNTTTTTSCLVAPLMTKVSVYIMIRLMFSVFSVQYIFNTIHWSKFVVWLAAIAIVAGSVGALAQRNLKRMLCYIIVAEVGYMVGGTWLANINGLTGAVYHILSDAMMTLCMFMAVGAIIYKTGDTSLEAVRDIFKKMPVTSIAFLIGAFSMIGIPPTCGFFTKWYLVSGAAQAGQWGFLAALLFSSLMNAILFFRLIEIGYYDILKGNGSSHGHHGHEKVAVAEAPLTMLIPLLITAASLIGIGLYTSEIVTGAIRWTMPAGLF